MATYHFSMMLQLSMLLGNCVYNTKDRPSELRLSIAYNNFEQWEYYKDFMVDLLMVNSADDYKNLFTRDWEYGRSVELTAIYFLSICSKCVMKVC